MTALLDDTNTLIELESLFEEELECDFDHCSIVAKWAIFCPTNNCFATPLCNEHADGIFRVWDKAVLLKMVYTCNYCSTALPPNPNKFLRKI